ncbi:peptidogalycan biosysnthesis protein [Catellatospora chokoriensis]|uniref:GNAT family N-acetyltransferase n=1 Tax=Catellatospora chokoriensis TaxID=310353 RepID=A0A8J3JV58_9ACTN|nr:peptidogalycan biosysnthesis protein [Catellatospora chokoriensis]GIF87646.1 hypothetical protein Cch02nite_10900 [Catellatospora chokoriensis]
MLLTSGAVADFVPDLDSLGPDAAWFDHPALGLYSSAPWLRAHEALDDATAGYLRVSNPSGLSGAARLALPQQEANVAYRPHVMFPFHQEHPYALLGPRRGYRSQLPLAGSGSAAALLQATAERAARDGRRWLYALHLTTKTADAISNDRAALPLLAPLFDTVIPVQGQSMTEHLDSIGRNRRKRHRDRRKVAQLGLRFGRERLADCIEEILPLRQQTFRRHGSQRSPEDLLRELELMSSHFADYETLFTVRDPGNRRLLGYALVYQWGGWLWARSLGLVEELRTNSTPVIFELEFHLPLDLCFERGLRFYHLGPSNYASKLARGAVVRPLWQVALLEGEDVFPIDGLARWTHHVLTRLQADCRPHTLPPDLVVGILQQAMAYGRAHFGDDCVDRAIAQGQG